MMAAREHGLQEAEIVCQQLSSSHTFTHAQTLDFALVDPPLMPCTSANSTATTTSQAAHPRLNEVATEMKALTECILLNKQNADKKHTVQCERLCTSPRCSEGTAGAASFLKVLNGASPHAQTPVGNNIFSTLKLGDLLHLTPPAPVVGAALDTNTRLLRNPTPPAGSRALMEPATLDFFGEHLHPSSASCR